MQSEFYNVALDQIRYSLVWEDSQTLYNALDINTTDHLLIITSAGCNVLNTLLKNPASVTAIDLNAVQNKLLQLKKHIILHHDFGVYESLLGLNGVEAVQAVKGELLTSLPHEDQQYWSGFLDTHPKGLLTCGKLENYITGFYTTLPEEQQQRLRRLVTFDNVEEQYAFFIDHFHHTSFRQSFTTYFDDENLSKGRDPRLFKYTTETGGQAFYNRLLQQVSTHLVRDSFYFHFFFFGLHNLPKAVLPPCYQEQHYACLKQQISKLQVVDGEAVDYLLSPEGSRLNKASFSNIFEYTSHQEFENVCAALAESSTRHLQIVFWNLLNGQGESSNTSCSKIKIEKVQPSDQSCFYFKNVMLLTSV